MEAVKSVVSFHIAENLCKFGAALNQRPMKKYLPLILLLSCLQLNAKEGMWLPVLLEQLNIDDMQANGLKLSAEDIYSINQSSLKDAVVHFNGGCTSEMISADGLLLTNHHCGYGQIQSHSSVEHDYLTDGFWAMSREEELPNPGLSATFIVRMEDVTDRVLAGIDENTMKKERERKIKENIEKIKKGEEEGTHYEARIKPFYYGNEYYMFITETFKDVRLVGAPPSSIGKYGFDTDNWMWPRHTGDFSLFRIYANKDNQPAEYSEDNVPYQPRHHFPISLKGYEKGDFTMVYGFPGRTQEYVTSYAVDLISSGSNPIKIGIRTTKLDIMNRAMSGSDEVRIKYAAKQSRTSNAWKKWKGQNRGLKKLDAIEKKQAWEREFEEKVNGNPTQFKDYVGLIKKLEHQYDMVHDVTLARDYFVEIAYFGTDIVSFSRSFNKLVADAESGKTISEDQLNEARHKAEKFFKDFDLETDKEIFTALFSLYEENVEGEFRQEVLDEVMKKHKGSMAAFADDLYAKSYFADKGRTMELLEAFDKKSAAKVRKDPAFDFMTQLWRNYNGKVRPRYTQNYDKINELNATYMRGQIEVFPERMYYPDANSTLRVTYGKVDDYAPADGVHYRHYTTLDGVIEKYDPDNKEYHLPQKLIDLHTAKDYGQYGQDGELYVCFTASNHTTGGNSGSPVIDGNGALIGLNFDRNWEGTMSDLMYDPDQCRNISVDIRYVLFIVDKFAGATHLIDELTLIEAESAMMVPEAETPATE